MAWQVALIADTETPVDVATGLMPLWACATEERLAYVPEWRESWDLMWYPEPGFTLISSPVGGDVVEWVLAQIRTIEEHHPSLHCLHLFGLDFGLEPSSRLNHAMAALGYLPAQTGADHGLTFSRPLDASVKVLILDASNWSLKGTWFWMQDFYTAFFKAVEAPEWHGRNLDALDDSIGSGGINKVEVPYRILLRNVPRENSTVELLLGDLLRLIEHLKAQGCPVSLDFSD